MDQAKGGRRPKDNKRANSKSEDLAPVNLDKGPNTWLKCSNNETTLSAYLEHAKWLRRLITSWPVLTVFFFFHGWSENATKHAAFQILHLGQKRGEICEVKTPLTEWPLNGGVDSDGEVVKLAENDQNERKAKRMTWVLMSLIQSCKRYTELKPEENQARNEDSRAEFAKEYGVELPEGDIVSVSPNVLSNTADHFGFSKVT